MKRGEVDLRECSEGDILISALGAALKYIKPLPKENYYDHEVEYLQEDLGNGSRTHDGYVFRKNRKPSSDHDIVEIIKRSRCEMSAKDIYLKLRNEIAEGIWVYDDQLVAIAKWIESEFKNK